MVVVYAKVFKVQNEVMLGNAEKFLNFNMFKFSLNFKVSDHGKAQQTCSVLYSGIYIETEIHRGY